MGTNDLIGQLYEHLLANSKELDNDIAKIVSDNFWDLI